MNLSANEIIKCDRRRLAHEAVIRLRAMMRRCGDQSSLSITWGDYKGVRGGVYHFIQFTESAKAPGSMFWEVSEKHLEPDQIATLVNNGFCEHGFAGPAQDPVPAASGGEFWEVASTTADIFFDLLGLPEPAEFVFDLIDQGAPKPHDGADAGHGDHWGCLEEEVSELPDRWLRRAVADGMMADHREPGPLEEGEAIGIVWPAEGSLRVLSLIAGVSDEDGEVRNVLASAYPYAHTGRVYRLVIEDIIPWANGIEGWLTASFAGEDGPIVTFFDTRFYAHNQEYRIGMEADFILSGLAYRAVDAHPDPVFITDPDRIRAMRAGTDRADDESPVEIRLNGAAILIPRSDADPDDYEFQAPVLERERFDLNGRQVMRLTATVMRLSDSDRDISIDIYVGEHGWGNDARPSVGSDVQGVLWLQGHMVTT